MWTRLYATGFQWHHWETNFEWQVSIKLSCMYLGCCDVGRTVISNTSATAPAVRWTFAWENYKSTGTIRVLKHHVLFQTENTIGLPANATRFETTCIRLCLFPTPSILCSRHGQKEWKKLSRAFSCKPPVAAGPHLAVRCQVREALSFQLGSPKSGLMCLSERVPRCCDLSFFSCFFPPFVLFHLG